MEYRKDGKSGYPEGQNREWMGADAEPNRAIEILLSGIQAELYIRNEIEWLKAMIEYSDEPEKYKKLLEGLMKNDFRTREKLPPL